MSLQMYCNLGSMWSCGLYGAVGKTLARIARSRCRSLVHSMAECLKSDNLVVCMDCVLEEARSDWVYEATSTAGADACATRSELG
jgi:hypothetical protein